MTAVIDRPTVNADRTPILLVQAVPWICREAIAPRIWPDVSPPDTRSLWLESNGSEGCYGGWELRFPVSVEVGDELLFELEAEAKVLPRGTDALVVEAFWHDPTGAQVDWAPVFLDGVSDDGVSDDGVSDDGVSDAAPEDHQTRARFAARLRSPAGASELRVRCGIRWSPVGRVRWHNWRLRPVPAAPPRLLRLGVASAKPERWVDMETNARHYVEQCRLAGEAGVDLVCLPELILTLGMREKGPHDAHAAALPLPGPWLEPFQDVARRYRMGICFSVYERAGKDGEVVYNTAILLGKDGELIGRYRKVHLALAEARRGITAGHEFPVFDFDGVAIGMLICMDSSPAETARILARKGAEIMLMPIAGDFRANEWMPRGQRRVRFHAERWKLIQEAHAFDNHLYTVVARNHTEGSAIAAPWGEILAYDDGSNGLIWADVDVDDRRRHPTGSTMQAVIWSMRRPYTYAPLADATMPAGLQSRRHG
ncbi:MAG: carbon-nitrogen hydrolase family protein [Chloroflexi bacterium]|nr:carbon-nitrogen hydrolase family protein [Chloroflexota bacterium]